jgi:hypothetical protein
MFGNQVKVPNGFKRHGEGLLGLKHSLTPFFSHSHFTHLLLGGFRVGFLLVLEEIEGE